MACSNRFKWSVQHLGEDLAGVRKPRALRGRVVSLAATASKSSSPSANSQPVTRHDDQSQPLTGVEHRRGPLLAGRNRPVYRIAVLCPTEVTPSGCSLLRNEPTEVPPSERLDGSFDLGAFDVRHYNQIRLKEERTGLS